MDYTFSFTLTEEEYISFFSDQIIQTGKMRGYQLFLYTSVPALLITLLILFKQNQLLLVCAVLAVCGLWILYGVKPVFRKYVERKVRTKWLPKLDIKEYKEITYHFSEKGIVYHDNQKVEIPYEKIRSSVPFSRLFAFYHELGTLLLPYRVFASETELHAFLLAFEKRWNAVCHQ